MKKIISIILFNLLLIVIFLGIFEFCLYQNHHKNQPEINYKIKEVKYNDILNYYRLRPAVGVENSKRPIILAGCSYAYGQGLNDEQTFGYKLSHYTKRPVYNFSLPGKGIQHNLFFLQNKMYDETIKNPEYFIYIMMKDHIRRLYTTVCLHDYTGYPEYKLNSENKLILNKDKYPFYKQFYVYYFFNNLLFNYVGSNNHTKHTILIKEYFREIKKTIKEEYPNIKFVILFYGDYDKYFNLQLDELQQEGFIFIHAQDLINKNLFDIENHLSENDFHPSEKLWDTFTPEFAKKLDL